MLDVIEDAFQARKIGERPSLTVGPDHYERLGAVRMLGWSFLHVSNNVRRLRAVQPGIRAGRSGRASVARRLAAIGFLHYGIDNVVVHAGFLQPDQILGAGVEVGSGSANLT